MRTIRLGITLMCTLLVVSCGGGGDGSQPTATAAKTIVYSSAGDAGKYVGKWSMGCGLTSVTPIVLHGTTKLLNITSANGAYATGTLTINDYGENNTSCQGTPSTTTSDITIQFISTSPIDNTDFSGSADQIKYTPFNSSSQNLFSSFNASFSELRFTASTNLSKFDGKFIKN